MGTATITIQVDREAARAFTTASEQDRRKLQLLLSLRLRELTSTAPRPLKDIMDEIGARAEANGLTPELVESMLHGG